jgi:hypothetical protein
VNPWLREFLKADAEMGVFSMYSELAAADNRFEGYVRPILENPQFFDSEADEQGPFRKAWEGLVNIAAKILENKEEQQVATQIPLRGEFEDPSPDIVTAMVNLLRNASSPRSRTRSKARSRYATSRPTSAAWPASRRLRSSPITNNRAGSAGAIVVDPPSILRVLVPAGVLRP